MPLSTHCELPLTVTLALLLFDELGVIAQALCVDTPRASVSASSKDRVGRKGFIECGRDRLM
jgi:hypothetical protein